MGPLDYGCTAWRKSSHQASTLYNDGVKLWRKSDLRDIEEQLARSESLETFSVRTIHGTEIQIKNPLYGEMVSIWRPRVKFQEYWHLVKTQPDGPTETWHCSYFVDWINSSARAFLGVLPDASSFFEANKATWDQSKSRELMRKMLQDIPVAAVTKVIGFGLGDMCRRTPEWMRRGSREKDPNVDLDFARGPMIQHAIMITIAEVCRGSTDKEVKLLAQDPDYTDKAEEILRSYGFDVVGKFGAGGFADIDEHSIVCSVHVEAPLKQIIADMARPLLFITTGFGAFNDSEKPWADPDSPRTKSLWEEYNRYEFPIAAEDKDLLSGLTDVYLYIRKSTSETASAT